MASITIRKLDDTLKSRLRVQAAAHGRSMEAEVVNILSAALSPGPALRGNLAASIRGRFERLGGVDLPAVSREQIRAPVNFDE
jgi:plasmid stability protein